MDVFEDVGSDDGVEVSVHEVEHQVDVSVVFVPDHILERRNDLLGLIGISFGITFIVLTVS